LVWPTGKRFIPVLERIETERVRNLARVNDGFGEGNTATSSIIRAIANQGKNESRHRSNLQLPKTKEEVMRRLIVLLACTAAMLVWALPAFAGPFTDVPTDHWAYDAIDKLQSEGFVEGYPDGTFRGNRSFTRYEMAMVVARIWDRLVSELEALQRPEYGRLRHQRQARGRTRPDL